jgi:hypothetical protein
MTGQSTTNRIFITAAGPGEAIGSVSVGGRMENTLLLAGYNTALAPTAVNASSIGRVFVGSDLIASSIVAGVTNPFFPIFIGTGLDAAVPDPSTLSRIGSVVVKGYAMGTPGGAEFFGIVAEQVGRVVVGSARQDIPSVGNFTPVGATFTGGLRDLNIHVVTPA